MILLSNGTFQNVYVIQLNSVNISLHQSGIIFQQHHHFSFIMLSFYGAAIH